MGINSINSLNSNFSYGAYSQKLTEATKQKLEELGIQYTSNTTEAQAKAMIAAKEAQTGKNEETTNKSEKYNQQNNASLNNSNQQQSDLVNKAMKLAEKLGISVDQTVQFDAILAKIETVLEQKINANQNDINVLKKLKGYSQELANIQAQSNGNSGFDNSNQALMKSLEILSEYNKNMLYN